METTSQLSPVAMLVVMPFHRQFCLKEKGWNQDAGIHYHILYLDWAFGRAVALRREKMLRTIDSIIKIKQCPSNPPSQPWTLFQCYKKVSTGIFRKPQKSNKAYNSEQNHKFAQLHKFFGGFHRFWVIIPGLLERFHCVIPMNFLTMQRRQINGCFYKKVIP